jgi:NADH-quinone oxidoreductase subunit G
MALIESSGDGSLEVNVCFGTGCFLKGSQKLLHDVLEHIRQNDLNEMVNVSASFCFERCDRGPTIRVGEEVIERCTPQMAMDIIDRETGHLRGEVVQNA